MTFLTFESSFNIISISVSSKITLSLPTTVADTMVEATANSSKVRLVSGYNLDDLNIENTIVLESVSLRKASGGILIETELLGTKVALTSLAKSPIDTSRSVNRSVTQLD